jgi:hypothetical protein
MSTHDPDDPGADTAMFRAYVDDRSAEPASAPATNRLLVIALVAAIVALALIGLLLLA